MSASPGAVAVLAALVVAGELRGLRAFGGEDEDGEEAPVASPFALAVLVTAGLPTAALVRALASAVPRLAHGAPWREVAAGAGRHAVGLLAAAGVLAAVAGLPPAGGGLGSPTAHLPAVALAAAALLVTDTVVAAASAARSAGRGRRRLGAALLRRVAASAALLALTPVVLVCAERGAWLVSLAALPVFALRGAGRDGRERHQALHDPLTDLPNRRLFRDRVEQAVLTAGRTTRPLAVMVLDLDRFKEVNDTLGHHVGDLLLQAVGTRLRATLREGDTIARLGGDEFAVLLPVVSGEAAAAHVAAKLLAALGPPFALEGWSFSVRASIGIAVHPAHGDDVDALLQHADVAMYVAKEARSGHEVYRVERDRHSPRRLALLGDLGRAVELGQLTVEYQPMADLAAGAVVSAEALLRWDHPEHGLVPPREFLPLAEHSGLVEPLTRFVLDAALDRCAAWRAEGLDLTVAVDVGARNLLAPGFCDEVARRLTARRLQPASLTLELDEATLPAEDGRAAEVLARLGELGVGLTLDHFGAGTSTLSRLRGLPVDRVKLDASLLGGEAGSGGDPVLVRSAVGLARALGLRVAAEGVDTEEAWERVTALGCDVAQGRHLSGPASGDALGAWMRALPPPAGVAGEAGARGPSLEEVCRRLSGPPRPRPPERR